MRFIQAIAALALLADPFAAERERMVREQIEARGVRDADVLRVLRATPRHLFVPEPAASAKETLSRLGYANVTARQGDGYKGWPEEAPFERIVVTAAPPEMPQALVDQLAKGGRLVAPVGTGINQELILIEKRADG